MIRALIAEDEPLLRDELRAMLGRVWPELDVVALAPDGPAAIAAIEEHRPEVAFLDIKMPGMSGIEVARAIGTRAHMVFVTAYDRHAIEAFDGGAVDYLVKPVTEERLATTVARLKVRLASAPASLEATLEKLAEALRKEGREPLQLPQTARTTVVAFQNQHSLLATGDAGGVFDEDRRHDQVGVEYDSADRARDDSGGEHRAK